MTTFKDKVDREWDLSLTEWAVKAIRKETGVSLWMPLTESKVWDFSALDLYMKPEQFGEILWVLVREQAGISGVSQEDYQRGFDADTRDRATVAFLEAVLDFSPLPAEAKAVLKKAARATGGENGDRPNESISSGGVVNSPDSSALTPDHTPLAS